MKVDEAGKYELTKRSVYSAFQSQIGAIVRLEEGDLRWRRNSQAAIIANLPSRQALYSDTGLILGRQLSDWSDQRNAADRRFSRVQRIRRESKSSIPDLTPRLSKILKTQSDVERKKSFPVTFIADEDYDEEEEDEEDDLGRLFTRSWLARRMSLKDGTHASSENYVQKRHCVRSMIASLQVKRRYRDQILQESVRDVHGPASWQMKRTKAWTQFRQQINNVLYQLEPWASALKTVEGNFGTAVMSYFRFLRWLLFLNLYITIIITCLTMVPHLALHNTANVTESDEFVEEARACTSNYAKYRRSIQDKEGVFNKILDFLQGTGWMEHTVLFYGVYDNKTFTLPTVSDQLTYNMGLVYLLATGAVFIISFLLLVRNSGKGLKEGVSDDSGKMSRFCNKVFSGWDFCISNQKSAVEKHGNLFQELHSDLANQRLIWKKSSRTTKDKAKLYAIRALVNVLVIFMLVGSLVAIYFSNEYALELLKEFDNIHPIVQFLIQFMPSLTITLLNVIVPTIMKKLVMLEEYMPSFEIRMTLLRTVMLRLASLLTLMFSLYIILNNTCDNEVGAFCNDTRTSWDVNEDDQFPFTCGNRKWYGDKLSTNNSTLDTTRGEIKCWETYVGQQIYKLIILDFLVPIIVTFLVEYPRALVYKRFHERVKVIAMVGQQEFDLPKAVLDLVYSQTLCWMGLFFSPLIPAMCVVKCFIMFYVKKGSLLHNCTQPARANRTSRSNSLFIGMLLISFCLVCIPLTYIITNFSPSQSCGPFRIYSKMDYVYFDTVRNLVSTFPPKAQETVNAFGTMKFFAPAIALLCFLMYYYCAVSMGYKRKAKILGEQLKLEGRDKQFLLARVNEAWQHLEVTNG